MERKIGEIFELSGEWYQCLEEKTCTCFGCDFRSYKCDSINLQKIKGSCMSGRREDNKPVIFKKLEKVGEPYQYIDGIYQQYKAVLPFFIRDTTYIETTNGFAIKTKQIKENMEEKKLNLKPFDLQKAKEGKPVCTREGRNVRIICFDCKIESFPIVALVSGAFGREEIISYDEAGYSSTREPDDRLFMLPEKKIGWINVYNKLIYNSEEDARDGITDDLDYVGTIKVEWEG